ncbi:Uncharacterized membrane protein [Lentzea xinjiangensis]|uniref:Uncharacterized membrane protein n=1 Tax=Lentzea xinjiangensis TaxID=402600 RepID=A0A1H9SV09_9PSEU|nr:DUF1345 domain-containing protein [Lentzea xinjiangensis]SER88842.1 Uncharacterized membrane protein [Lentzea xinjiangensis]
MIKTVQRALSRAIEAVLILLGVMIFFSDNRGWITLWDVFALIYLGIRVARVRASRRGKLGENWLSLALGPRAGLLFTIFTSIAGITAGLSIVMGVDGGDETADLVNKVIAVPAVLLAWAILHFGYAERYAQAYYRALPEQILVFPGSPEPTYADFAYFAFTVGTTFAVSDVDTNGSIVRVRVLAHSVLAFVYNTATLGIAIGVVTGD